MYLHWDLPKEHLSVAPKQQLHICSGVGHCIIMSVQPANANIFPIIQIDFRHVIAKQAWKYCRSSAKYPDFWVSRILGKLRVHFAALREVWCTVQCNICGSPLEGECHCQFAYVHMCTLHSKHLTIQIYKATQVAWLIVHPCVYVTANNVCTCRVEWWGRTKRERNK